jgi:hypothetical protein
MSDAVTQMKNGTPHVTDQADVGKLLIEGMDERFEIQWDNEAKVTPMGSLVYFAQYVKAGGLLDRLCKASPLVYESPNAPKERDVFGTVLLSIWKRSRHDGGRGTSPTLSIQAQANHKSPETHPGSGARPGGLARCG